MGRRQSLSTRECLHLDPGSLTHEAKLHLQHTQNDNGTGAPILNYYFLGRGTFLFLLLFSWFNCSRISIRIVIGRHVLSYKLISFHSLQIPILPLFFPFPPLSPFPTSGWLRKLCLPRHSFASSLSTTSPPPSASLIDFSHPFRLVEVYSLCPIWNPGGSLLTFLCQIID